MARELYGEELYGPLWQFIRSETVTDINFNGRKLWVDDLVKGRYCAENVNIDQTFLERFSMHLSNQMNTGFNRYHPVLEAETKELRISVLHESVSNTGRSVSIRKIPSARRITPGNLYHEGFCLQDFDIFMANCVKAGFTIMVAGLPGAGKTEYLKYLTRFIPADQKVITVEDNLEIHYGTIEPDKDGIELKVGDNFSYAQAIKASMRQLPRWLILSEARSREAEYLLEALSTGVSGMTTIHTDDVRKIPDRICNMAKADLINDVYTFLDIGILIGCYHVPGKGILRRIEQAALFDRREGENEIEVFYEDGILKKPALSEAMKRKFRFAGIQDPFGEAGQGVLKEAGQGVLKEAVQGVLKEAVQEI